jgi:hypothetical protein
MNIHPPFDPPYTTTYGEGGSRRIVETLADGTTRTVTSDQNFRTSASPLVKSISNKSNLSAGTKSVTEGKPDFPIGNTRASLFLKVSFSEKDEAKSAGARWDSKASKWYVPHGLDINLFDRWWPDSLK